MKVLIGYDGSECSDSALDDLKAAGLPPNVEAHVISVAEVWLPPPPAGMTVSQYARDLQTHAQPFTAWESYATEISGMEARAKEAADRLRSSFGRWQVTSEGTYGSPAWEIVSKAAQMNVDLIILGSHGRSVIRRFFLGSISQKVLTEAKCSVRIGRGKAEVDPSRARIVIGYDGSGGANAAVDVVVSRYWPKDTEVKLVAVTEGTGTREWLLELTANAVSKLGEAGLATELIAQSGNPKNVIADFAENWDADSIFVGANRFGSRVERFVLGSVSAAVAARSHCSVEVIRRPAIYSQK